MKKKFVLALALALTLSLTACNNPKAEPAASSPEQSVTEVSTPDESVPEQPEEAAPTESTPEQPEETPAVEVAPEEPISTEPIGEPTPAEPVDLFTDTSETVYATNTVNMRSEPSTDSQKLGQLTTGASVTRTGIGTGEVSGWSEVKLADGSTAYVSSKYLTTIKPEPKPVEQTKPVEKPVQPTVKDEDADITPEQEQAAKESEQSHFESQHQAVLEMQTGSGDLYDGKPDENGHYSMYETVGNTIDGVEVTEEDGAMIFIIPSP